MSPFTTIDASQWIEACERANGKIIDVRTDGEFAESYIKNAEQVDFMSPMFKDNISAYDRDQSYFVYCRSGKRSEGAMNLMKEMGFAEVYNLDGGILAWEQQGRDVEGGAEF